MSSPGCLFALVLAVVVGGLLALRGRGGDDSRADRLSGGRWRPERAAAFAECEAQTRASLAASGLAAEFPQVDPATRAVSTDGRRFRVESYVETRLANGTRGRMPYQCALERDPSAATGWKRTGGSAG